MVANGQMNGYRKMWYIHTIEYYSAIRKNEITFFYSNTDGLDIIILSEVGQK